MVDVVVVGSINQDVTVRTPRFPDPGETIVGSDHFFGPGGKGANQAVAAARMGARTAMVGRVGDDGFGQDLTANLRSEGIDTSAVGVDENTSTGIAVITVDDAAENSIVGSLGANLQLTPGHLERHEHLIAEARVVLAQLEIPIETVMAAAEMTEGRFVLVPAPASDLPQRLLEHVDILVPNRGELAMLTGSDDVGSAATGLPCDVVVTLGGEGALLVANGESHHIAPFEVDPIDTTGAGDAFAGALAASLAEGMGIREAAVIASAAGGLAVTKLGAQSAIPYRDEVEALVNR